MGEGDYEKFGAKSELKKGDKVASQMLRLTPTGDEAIQT